MGMFDTFYHDTAITCCSCGKQNNFQDGVQSKEFECLLYNYSIGDLVDGCDADDVAVEDYTWCEKCSEEIPIYFGFRSSIFTGIYATESEARESSLSFDLIKQYKQLYVKKTQLDTKVKRFERDIQTLIDVFGSKPTKKKFNTSFTFFYDGIDYDIITSLQNILNNN